jgi:hypothetical protein
MPLDGLSRNNFRCPLGTNRFSLYQPDYRDVAIIFHAHFLSPFRFCADMCSRGPNPVLLQARISFPLAKMHDLIANDIWSDPESEYQWNQAYPRIPYQLWASSPLTTNAPLRLQNIDMVCPWCEEIVVLDLAKFSLMHTRKMDSVACPKCHVGFNADKLSCVNLLRDLKRFTAQAETGREETWYPL